MVEWSGKEMLPAYDSKAQSQNVATADTVAIIPSCNELENPMGIETFIIITRLGNHRWVAANLKIDLDIGKLIQKRRRARAIF